MLGNDNVGDNCIQDVRTGKNSRTYIELAREAFSFVGITYFGLPLLAITSDC